ncbi:hypothetical protein AAC387_Pa04g1684 [Persea americana]
MLVYCPMFEDLALKSCSDFPSSEISATDLKNIKSCTLSGGCNWSAYVGSFLSKLAHVQILAIGQMMMHGFKVPGYENATGNLPITLSDVIELQLEVLNISTLSDIYDLFTNWNFPCLEKLMVKWSPDGCSWTGRADEIWTISDGLVLRVPCLRRADLPVQRDEIHENQCLGWSGAETEHESRLLGCAGLQMGLAFVVVVLSDIMKPLSMFLNSTLV